DKATSSGTYLMDDFISPRISALQESINTKAESEVSAISAEIERLNEQVEPLVSKFIRTGDASLEESINDIQNELRDLDTELNARLYDIGNQVSSFPQYNSEDLDDNITQYTFYKPIVFRSQNDKSYFRGVVRLGISTDGILTTITASSEQLIKIIAVIAAAAIVLGILGALILASIIVKPINKLVRGVEVIRDTEDKEDLKDHEIIIKTGDELSVLADTVNQMIDNLVEAASANKLLTVGKEVQKKFIPLEEDSTGNKLSTGKEDNENVEFFGYYEGARGVSGDYFDFRKIDDVHYAAIKCDVAGKGVPASLIMVEVATIFLNFFRNRKIVKTKSGKPVPPNISELTYSINDLVEEVGFTGRFAAFTIAIVNSLTGDIFLCNAGDNLVHIFDSSQQKMIIKELPESPASGVFPSDMVRMGKGFVQVKDRLKPGDCLLMFTDGLEEAQRHLRGSDFKVLKPEVTDEERSSMPESVNHDDGFEEFGVWRIQELINTLKAGGQYTLHKYYNPVADESLIFDFSDLEGTIEDIVLACVSVERIFRIYPDPSAGPDDRVRVDKVIVKFLEEHFNQWNVYFSNPLPGKDEDHYITFSHLKEDDQYDDLTVLGISKK
ncbi:MAG: SpoIIE family protein phosphatase, partial [Spirochaetales bacterium]|nr:SpoIIE family protein phosphatase [Spirochaetales bacterium]